MFTMLRTALPVLQKKESVFFQNRCKSAEAWMQTLLRQPSLSPATVSTMTLILSHPWQRGLSKQKLNGMKEVLQSCQHIALATPLSARRVVRISKLTYTRAHNCRLFVVWLWNLSAAAWESARGGEAKIRLTLRSGENHFLNWLRSFFHKRCSA